MTFISNFQFTMPSPLSLGYNIGGTMTSSFPLVLKMSWVKFSMETHIHNQHISLRSYIWSSKIMATSLILTVPILTLTIGPILNRFEMNLKNQRIYHTKKTKHGGTQQTTGGKVSLLAELSSLLFLSWLVWVVFSLPWRCHYVD
jgi:hypothetical protein